MSNGKKMLKIKLQEAENKIHKSSNKSPCSNFVCVCARVHLCLYAHIMVLIYVPCEGQKKEEERGVWSILVKGLWISITTDKISHPKAHHWKLEPEE